MVNVKPVQLGKNTRMSFAHINEVLDMPNLIEMCIRDRCYCHYCLEGLLEGGADGRHLAHLLFP